MTVRQGPWDARDDKQQERGSRITVRGALSALLGAICLNALTSYLSVITGYLSVITGYLSVIPSEARDLKLGRGERSFGLRPQDDGKRGPSG
ncbi:MAG TPA: hypothetical protein VJ036_01175 [bacterium]|nr:hypothetical protein [bacterium]